MKNRDFRLLILSALTMVIGLAFLTMPVCGQVQNHLILKKKGYINKMHFLAGDPIQFVREGNKFAEEGYIDGIGTDFIVISGFELPISKISTLIRYRTGFSFDTSGKLLMIAAPGYLLIGVINELFRGANILPTKTNLIVAGSLLASGAIFTTFQVRKYRIGKKFTLKIVQSDPSLNR